MATEIKTPEFPESVQEGTLLAWNKKNGDSVIRDELLAQVETDKIVLEVFALENGTLSIGIEEGEIVTSGDVIGTIESGKNNGAKRASTTKTTAKKETSTTEAASRNSKSKPTALSPSVRNLLNEHGLSSEEISGSGKDGRITVQDVKHYLRETPVPTPDHEQPSPAISLPSSETSLSGDMPERRVPMTRIRQSIARRLVEVQHTAAILTTFNEVDMKPVQDIRSRYKEKFYEEYGVKLGLMSFFVKATVEALKKFPIVNASIEEENIVYHEYFNVGIAVDSPRGLVVPVVKHADQLSFAEIERKIRQLAAQAKDAQLKYDQLIGGTFTITNGGTFGSMLSTPILNAPQSAILGMHNIVSRPVAVGDEVKIRPIMYLALSYDHRVIDGRDAVQFLVSIKSSLEEPEKLLLQL